MIDQLLRNFLHFESIGRTVLFQLFKTSFAIFSEMVIIPDHKLTRTDPLNKNLFNELLGCDIETATHFLGRPYSLTGRVVAGNKLGRLLGFPTANIEMETKYKLVPKDGIYAATVTHGQKKFQGMLYIGNRPVIKGTKQSIEVNIFDFSKDIYGEDLTIHLHTYIRADMDLSDLEQLKKQLKLDEEAARKILNAIL